MNKVEKASIGGIAFTFNTDAYEAVSRYLTELETFYASKESGAEIMEGIEERFAELLQEKCAPGQVVSSREIEDVIHVLGRPSDIEDEASEAPRTAKPEPEKPKKQLFRDIENKQLGGVCSGLAAYFSFDVTLIRILFVALSAACLFAHDTPVPLLFPAIYLILWICMPAARTVKQRWAQKGQDGSVQEVSRLVETGTKEAKGHGLGRFLLAFIGVILLLSGVSGLTAGTLAVADRAGGVFTFSGVPYLLNELDLDAHIWSALRGAWDLPWVKVLVFGAWFLPFLGMLYGGIQLIFGFKSPSWRPGLVIFILWLVDLVILSVSVVGLGLSSVPV
mgnify:CR=1 FL=1